MSWAPFNTASPLRVDIQKDDAENRLVFRQWQNCQPIIEANKERQKEHRREVAGMRKLASIPLWVVLEWKRKHGVDVLNQNHEAGVIRLLNDPDYRWLRCTSEHIA